MNIFIVLLSIVIALVIALLIKDYFERQSLAYKTFSKYPHGKILPIFGSSLDFASLDRAVAFKLVRALAVKYGKSYCFWYKKCILSAIRYKEVEKILTSSKNIEKGVIYNLLQPFLNTGLLTSKGEKWLIRRRILTPAFHFSILSIFFNTFKEESQKLIEVLNKRFENAEDIIVDIKSMSSRFTLNTICETAMGVKLDELKGSREYQKNIHKIGNLIAHRSARPWFYSDFIYKLFGHKKVFDEFVELVHGFTKKIIHTRRMGFSENDDGCVPQIDDYNSENIYSSKKNRYAMLDTLLKAEKDGFIDQQGIQEEVDTFTFEGHDTTSAGLMFSLLMLAHHPEAQEGILEELKEVTKKDPGNSLSIEELNSLNYLNRVIKECLRIYPPVPFISRLLVEDLIIDDTTFPKNTSIIVHIFDLHRDPEQFPDPEKFDPDRFLPENVAKRHPFAYVPFSAGLRNCIGQKFAMIELKTVIVEILQKFKLSPITKRADLVFLTDLVLRSKHPIYVKFTRRI